MSLAMWALKPFTSHTHMRIVKRSVEQNRNRLQSWGRLSSEAILKRREEGIELKDRALSWHVQGPGPDFRSHEQKNRHK